MRKPIRNLLKLKTILVCAVFWVFPGRLFASDKLSVKYDSLNSVAVRNFDNSSIQKFKSDPDFTYAEGQPDQHYEFNWLAKLLRKLFGFSFNKHSLEIWEILLYVGAGAVLLFVLWNMINGDKSWFMRRSARKPKIRIEEVEQNIHEMDLDMLIREAIAQKHYRKAVRLLYLKSLKELNAKNLIEWSSQKTNSDYLRELKGGPLKKSFKTNTIIFEHIWYGDFHIDESLLEKIMTSFDSFISEIKRN